MRYRLRTLLLLGAAVPPVLAVGWHMPAIGLSSNCGGNNAAQAYVRGVAATMFLFAVERPERQFNLASATPQQRRALASCAVGWGISGSDILISTRPLDVANDSDRQIVAICDRPFTNVPQYMFRRAAPSHAVAFSDFSTTLMSAREYAALDRSSFVPLNEIDRPRSIRTP
jgi:hypothetical protein